MLLFSFSLEMEALAGGGTLKVCDLCLPSGDLDPLSWRPVSPSGQPCWLRRYLQLPWLRKRWKGKCKGGRLRARGEA